MGESNDRTLIPIRSKNEKPASESSATSTATSSPKLFGLTKSVSNLTATESNLPPAAVEGKGPAPSRKPTMTSRFSGLFRKDGYRDVKDVKAEANGRSDAQAKGAQANEAPPSSAQASGATTPKTNGSSPNNGLAVPNGGLILNNDALGNALELKTDDHGNYKRFWTNDDGTHGHYLKAAKRHQKLKDMLRNWWDKKKAEKEPGKPLPDAANKDDHPALTLMHGWATSQKKEAMEDKAELNLAGNPTQTQSLAQRYGRCQEIVGHGAFGIVRVAHKPDPKDPKKSLYYAVKEFHKRPNESDKKYQRRLTSEFCISSAMVHPNVIRTLELLKDDKGDFCEVMEFCAGGDLYTLILSAGNLDPVEADCYFKQLMRGVDYLHDRGVAHRDLKPENLLLTSRGCLKITDFGNGECFQTVWEAEPHLTEGLCGSGPYIAPEEYTEKEFSPTAVDVWACGVIYMAMRTGRHLWRIAKKGEDEFYSRYLDDRKTDSGFRPIEVLKRRHCRNVIYSILDPNPTRRLNAEEVLRSEWVSSIKICDAGTKGL